MLRLSSLLLLFMLKYLVCASSPNSTRPHIILIVADDLGYNDVSIHGSKQIPTPNLDFLAYNGIVLNNYYVSPICTPTRSALLTGRHPIHTGMQHNVIFGDQPYGLPLNETLISQHLNKLGYRSHIVGKWHLGMFQWDYTPLYRGFESHFGYYQGCEDYYDHTYEANLDQWGLDFRRDKDLLWNHTGQYSTILFRDEAVKVINNHNKSEPLFLYLPFQAVHSGNKDGPNLQAPEEYINKFSYIRNKQRRIYAGMVSALDDAVGVIYDRLESRGLLSNSIIIFTTDNGGPANGFDFNAANNFPLRGVKATLWEGGVRGVGFVHSPLLKTKGYISEQMLHVCDWLPTLYSAAGGDPSTLVNLDGFDAWQMLNDNGKPVRSEILHNIDPIDKNAAIRIGDYKLVVGNVAYGWNGWYPPYQLDGDETSLHISSYTDDYKESEERQNLRRHLQSQFKDSWSPDVLDRIQKLQSSLSANHKNSIIKFGTSSSNLDSELVFELEKDLLNKNSNPGQLSFLNSAVKVDCGPKPANASTNCNVASTNCLYNIKEDPCEYYNIADKYPDIVQTMHKRLTAYAATAVKPANKGMDPAGNPSRHGGAWVPWR